MMSILKFSLLLFLISLTRVQGLEVNQHPEALILVVNSKGGRIAVFEIQIADTEELRMIGLSGRQGLDKNKGLLLDFRRDTIPRIWMKNTRFSIDMLFIDSNGNIRSIYPRAEPFSLRIITPDIEVRYVLEILGGQAKNQDIEVGDRIKFLSK